MLKLVVSSAKNSKNHPKKEDRGRKKRPIVPGVRQGNAFFVLKIRKNVFKLRNRKVKIMGVKQNKSFVKQDKSFDKQEMSLPKLQIQDKSEKGAVRSATANKPAKSASPASDSRGKETMAPEARLNAAIDDINAAISGLHKEVSNAKPEAGSPKSEAREALTAPVLAALGTMGDSIFLRWSDVAGADYIEIELAYDAAFTERAGGMSVDGSRTWATLPEMPPDKTWFIHVRALGSDASMSSAWSNARSIRTLPEGMAGTNDEIATHLQTWLGEQQTMFENFASLIPQLDNTVLNTTDRRRLNGSGVRRYGFIEKVIEVAGEYPQFWPAFVEAGDLEKFAGTVKEIDVLRNLSIWFQFSDRVVQDLLLLAGDEAFRWAGLYYTTARDTARRKVPEAMQVYEKLKLFWRRRRRTTEEPTEQEVMRDFKRLMHGKVDGDIFAKHESPTTSGGVHEVIDNVHSAKCRVK